jgi:hypothetical protein
MTDDLAGIRFSNIPLVIRVVLSLTIIMLGIGYVIAVFNLYLTYSMTDGEPGLSANDLKRAFYGNRDNTRLAAKIHGGSMEQFLPVSGDKEKILSWIQDGAPEPKYQETVKPILEKNCIRCHNPAGLSSFRPLTNYQEVMAVTEIDRGEPVALWARVAHTHIQSIGLIFLVLGLVFSLTSLHQTWKLIIVVSPFLALLGDFGARALAKYFPNLVYIVMASGAITGMAIGIMILIPLYEMWLKKERQAV